jgi:hypothetical protein
VAAGRAVHWRSLHTGRYRACVSVYVHCVCVCLYLGGLLDTTALLLLFLVCGYSTHGVAARQGEGVLLLLVVHEG